MISFEGYCELPPMDVSSTQIQCEVCNDKKLAAKRVSDLSAELFFSIFVKVSFHCIWSLKLFLIC